MLLEQLSQMESDDRSRRNLERRLGLSPIRKFKLMADFDWNWAKHIERNVIECALILDFIKRRISFFVIGNTLDRSGLADSEGDSADGSEGDAADGKDSPGRRQSG